MIFRALAAIAAISLAGCAATTYDSSGTTAPADAPASAPFAASGTTAELLPQLDAELAGLSERIVDNEGDDDSLGRVDALWAEARPQVASERPELIEGFDGVIRLATTAVERRRPADADKARNNLITLLAAYNDG